MTGSVCKNLALSTRLSESKRQRIALRKSKRLLLLRFMLRATAVSLCALVIDYFLALTRTEFNYLMMISASIVILVAISYLINYFNDIYVFREHRIAHFHGLISLRLRRTSIAYVDIRETRVQQSIFQRLLNVGTILLGTASTGGHEVTIAEIARPHTIAKSIENHMAELHKRKLEREHYVDSEVRQQA